MSGERKQLLAAIRANPDDDAPRLVFADWLEENGEPDFAEFIRVEIERDRLSHDYDYPRREALHKHSDALRRRGAFPGETHGLNILSPTKRWRRIRTAASGLGK
jgi:uncharacterized protein (TIGR02996 family)